MDKPSAERTSSGRWSSGSHWVPMLARGTLVVLSVVALLLPEARGAVLKWSIAVLTLSSAYLFHREVRAHGVNMLQMDVGVAGVKSKAEELSRVWVPDLLTMAASGLGLVAWIYLDFFG